ncbi:tRNA 2-thiouridine(34) synthase MnmA [Fusibacter bizertensis]
MKKVAVGLSGGIDSGTTALLLKEQGFEVFGVTMWLFDHQTDELESSKSVASAVGIAHHILDYRHAFKHEIITNFITQYEQGLTPNPCVLCNQYFKYGKLIEDCLSLGADYFSTGHYAKCIKNESTGEYQLLRAENLQKDQSYNLYHLNQHILSKLIYPLGDMESKERVRAYFEKLNIHLSQKKDSLGICFIAHKDHSKFLMEIQSSAMVKGYFVDKNHTRLGEHNGTASFTIGQKRRLGIGYDGQYLNGRYVVTDINPLTHEVTLGSESELLYTEINCNEFNLISPSLKKRLQQSQVPLTVEVIVSQWSAKYTGNLTLHHSANSAVIRFDSPVRAPAKGQALVCYQDNILIGGGIITQTTP